MAVVTGKRVTERGRVTGSADLHVERIGDTVHVKLGMTRVQVPAEAWAELVRPTLAEPEPAGEYMGYTRDQLRAAFELVKNRDNWKGIIDATVPADADLDAISAACAFYAGSPVDIIETERGHRVTGPGYYICIGS